MSGSTHAKRFILWTFFAGSLLLVIYPAIFSFMDNDTARQSHTCKSLHQMQYVMDGGDWKARRSHNFSAFDWVMRADNSFAENLKVHDDYLCVDADDRKCNLQPHQMADFCPGAAETGSTWKARITDDLTEKQLVTTHSKDGIAEASGAFTYFNRGQTLATCARTRVIPSFLAPNDPTSWGLLSTHEPAHLIVFIGAIFSVAALTELVLLEHEHSGDESIMTKYFSKTSTVEGYSIILVLVLFIFRMATPSVLSFDGANYVRALANSSFLYGVLHYVFWCFYCSYRIRDVKHNTGYGVSAKNDYEMDQRKKTAQSSEYDRNSREMPAERLALSESCRAPGAGARGAWAERTPAWCR